MRRGKRVLRALDWRTLTVLSVLTVLVLAGFLILSGARATHDANRSADQRGRAATRRIDKLNAQIAEQAHEIAAASKQIGKLSSAQDALSEQIRQAGGTPVVNVTVTRAPRPAGSTPTSGPAPAPQPKPKPKPSPSASASKPPRPTPSPTCTRLPIVGTCRPLGAS